MRRQIAGRASAAPAPTGRYPCTASRCTYLAMALSDQRVAQCASSSVVNTLPDSAAALLAFGIAHARANTIGQPSTCLFNFLSPLLSSSPACPSFNSCYMLSILFSGMPKTPSARATVMTTTATACALRSAAAAAVTAATDATGTAAGMLGMPLC